MDIFRLKCPQAVDPSIQELKSSELSLPGLRLQGQQLYPGAVGIGTKLSTFPQSADSSGLLKGCPDFPTCPLQAHTRHESY